ncbi:integrase core domain-containing protein [Kineococcus rhizosphaerae]|uniref:Integrase-like protein n=1 Tax=Kineococcus rhizosphaerae TaxID=559628 RepID=A0A2T0QP58_9ACTN|nr:integrase core domain-containing protein [Kineococcus rhizosphaerae]PRY06448.1 integrase-like protein [Kineococcus rhizosphaerae]
MTRSYSRPRVSNDNPYSEAQFKTLKYTPAFPDRFEPLEQTRDFCEVFFAHYNYVHRHSGI